MTTIWVTKFAIESGVFSVDVRDTHSWGLEGVDWHRDLDSANATARRMRDREVEHLRGRLARLESMTFGEDDWRS